MRAKRISRVGIAQGGGKKKAGKTCKAIINGNEQVKIKKSLNRYFAPELLILTQSVLNGARCGIVSINNFTEHHTCFFDFLQQSKSKQQYKKLN